MMQLISRLQLQATVSRGKQLQILLTRNVSLKYDQATRPQGSMIPLLEPFRRVSGSHEVCRDDVSVLAPLSWASLLLLRYLQID